jgi:protein disulfide-isomerase
VAHTDGVLNRIYGRKPGVLANKICTTVGCFWAITAFLTKRYEIIVTIKACCSPWKDKKHPTFAAVYFNSNLIMSLPKIYLFLLLSGIAFQACAQPTTTTAEKPKPAAYASAKEGWLVDLDEAYALSQKNNKPILANFTGSDWCGWCKRLDADVFSKPEFKAWAQKNVVLLELDFPRYKQIPQKNQSQNAAMQQALQIRGYPTVWLIDLDKNPTTGQYNINGLGSTGYTPTVAQFISTLDKFMHP